MDTLDQQAIANNQALAGIRICDFTGQLAGAGATKWLAAFGAQVIRIEDPERQGRWDILRGSPPFKPGQQGLEYGAGFNNHNTDKLGITLNLRTPQAKEILRELINVSDAVTENFAAGVLEKWGFGYKAMREIKPELVYVSNCGFGHEGPYSRYKTWGPIVQAISGLTFTSTLPNQPPAGWGYSYMDHTGSYYMAMAIMLALLHKQQTGEGQWVDLACTEAAVTLNGPALLDWTVNDQPMRQAVQPSSNRSQYNAMAPHGIYLCQGQDEWVAISCRDERDWQKLSTHINEPWTNAFTDLESRLTKQDLLDEHLTRWTSAKTKVEVEAELQTLPIPVAAVAKPRERINNPVHQALWTEVNHTAMGQVVVDGQPATFSDTPWQSTHGAPCLSEHTHPVLTEILNYTDDEVSAFVEAGVV